MVTISWRTGVNMREFAYYDRPECRTSPAAPPTREAEVASLQKLGVPLVRFFAVNRNLNLDANIAQVGLALDLLKRNNMQAIVALADSLWDAGYTVPGDDDYHKDTPNGHLNKRYWHEQGYSKNYQPYVRQLVARYADHPAVLAWELGNEYAIQPQPSSADDFNAFIQFVQTVSQTIKQLSPRKLISTGLINTNQIAPGGSPDDRRASARKLYGLPNIDLISLHVYAEGPEDDFAMIDVGVAKELNKPFFVGELGANVDTMSNRAPFIQSQMDQWKGRGAFSAMLWAYDDSPQDTGVADKFGFGRRFGDFSGVAQVVTKFAAPAQPVVVDATTLPVGATTTTPVGAGEGVQPVGVRDATPTTSTPPPFTLAYPMTWPYTVLANFNDDVNYSGSPGKLQKREGMLFAPNSTDQPLEVRAAQRGRVTTVNNFPQGYGNYVCITHDWYNDTYVTWYGQLASISVAVGDHVNQGDVIGIAGQSGSASELCLFLTLQHKGHGLPNYVVPDVVDPLPYLSSAPAADRSEADWIADATYPDGSIVLFGQPFKKQWQIRNVGTTTWGAGYQLVQFSDEALGTTNSVPLPSANPGDVVVVGVDMVAPTTPGMHRTTWKPRDPQGNFFPYEQYAVLDVRASKTDTANPVLRFADWESIPDGSILTPGQAFTKTWRVRNDGNKVWDSTYQLVYVSGDHMGGPDSVPLPPLRPGQQDQISINLVAPQTQGVVRSTWRPRDPQGNSFDFDLWVEINVQLPGALNTADRFDAPMTIHWQHGPAFGDPVWYGDHKHKGLDYDVAVGTPLFAGGVGQVFKAYACTKCNGMSFDELNLTADEQTRALSDFNMGYTFGLGNLVIVRYAWNDLPQSARQAMVAANYANCYAFVYYAHLNEIRVNEGDSVQKGTLLGFSGETGNTRGAHLHLEVCCYASPTAPPLTLPRNWLDPDTMFVF